MRWKRFELLTVALLGVVLAGGCSQKTEARGPKTEDGGRKTGTVVRHDPAATRNTAVPPLETVARIHWQGMNRLSREKNAARFMTIWNLPATQKLERHTLDKLSTAPWRLLLPTQHSTLNTLNTQHSAQRLRPLLDDLVRDESYLEIRQATNHPGELVFAIRLTPARAALWQTNLAAVLESLTGIHTKTLARGNGWTLKKHDVPDFIEFTRAGHWTLLGAGENRDELVGDAVKRIQSGHAPFAGLATNDWLSADFDLLRVAQALGLHRSVPADWPEISVNVIGGGTNVLTRGQLKFPRRLAMDLQPWIIPTNLIDKALTSFTVARGFRSWVESSPAWKDLGIGPAPNQLCCWADYGLNMQTYFTAPLPDASNEVRKLTDLVLFKGSRWFASHDLSAFVRSKTYNGLEWKGLPYMTPFLRSLNVGSDHFIYGGGFPNAGVHPISGRLIQHVLQRRNLVYHGWEATGVRVGQWLYMSQFARFVSHKAQLPFGSPAVLWLKALEPKLGDSITDVVKTGANQLSFSRQSTIGFTAIELQFLADWLESPRFPVGLHTTLAVPKTPLPSAPPR